MVTVTFGNTAPAESYTTPPKPPRVAELLCAIAQTAISSIRANTKGQVLIQLLMNSLQSGTPRIPVRSQDLAIRASFFGWPVLWVNCCRSFR